MRVRPLWGFLVIKGEPPSTILKTTIEGFQIAGVDPGDDRPTSGIVLRAGPGEFQSWVEPNGFRRPRHGDARDPTECNPGDRVHFNPARPSWFDVDGEKVGIINERDVACVEVATDPEPQCPVCGLTDRDSVRLEAQNHHNFTIESALGWRCKCGYTEWTVVQSVDMFGGKVVK